MIFFRYLFHFNPKDPEKSLKIVVSRCPTEEILNQNELYNSKPILYRCIPALAVIQAFGHTIYEFISSYAPLKKLMSDLMNSYRDMSYAILVSLVFAFVSAFVIHLIAGIASWIILIVVSISLIGIKVPKFIQIVIHLLSGQL